MNIDVIMPKMGESITEGTILEWKKNIEQSEKDSILELLAIDLFKLKENFEITLLFKNNAFITLSTEVIEVTLEDLN